jgi:hypothetical protein
VADGEKRPQVQLAPPKTKSKAIVLIPGSSSCHMFVGFTSARLVELSHVRRLHECLSVPVRRMVLQLEEEKIANM